MQESRTQPTHNDELSFGRTVTIALVILIGVVTVIALLSDGSGEPEQAVAKAVPGERPAQDRDASPTAPTETESSETAPPETKPPETKPAESKPTETEPVEPANSSDPSRETTGTSERVAVKKPVVAAHAAESTPEPAAEVNGSTSAAEQPTAPRPEHESLTLKGRVVWLNSLLKDRFGIGTAADAKQQSLALDSTDGNLYPIVEDARGHAFRLDDRLRERPVEMLVRRYDGSPMIQVIRLYAIREDGNYELDYWCDICAIQMFQPGDCSCCQAKNRLRERKVEEQ